MDFLVNNKDIQFEESENFIDIKTTTEKELIVQNVISDIMSTMRGEVLWNESLGIDYGRIFGILKQSKPSDQQPYVEDYLRNYLTSYTSLVSFIDLEVEPDDLQNELKVTVYFQDEEYKPIFETTVKVER